jgi:DNA-directed RNA polymerase
MISSRPSKSPQKLSPEVNEADFPMHFSENTSSMSDFTFPQRLGLEIDEKLLKMSSVSSEGLHSMYDSPTSPLVTHELVDDSISTMTPYEKQYDMEVNQVEKNVKEYIETMQDVMKVNRGSTLPPSHKLLVEWFTPVSKAIDLEQAACIKGEPGQDRLTYGPYLTLLPPEKLAIITMHEVLSFLLLNGGYARISVIANNIGIAVNQEVNLNKLKYVDRRLWTKLSYGKSNNLSLIRQKARKILNETEWSQRIAVKVGSALLVALLTSAKIKISPDGVVSSPSSDTVLAKPRSGDSTPPSVSSGSSSRVSSSNPAASNTASSISTLLPAPNQEIQSLLESKSLFLEHSASKSNVAAMLHTLTPGSRPYLELQQRLSLLEALEPQPTLDPLSGSPNGFLIPAFQHCYFRKKNESVGVLKIHESIEEILRLQASRFSRATTLPMLIPPKPWKGPFEGGYLKQRVPLVRIIPGTFTQLDLIKRAYMPKVYSSLNALGRVPWKINLNVLPLIKLAWERDYSVKELPSKQDLPLPSPPSAEELSGLSPEQQVLTTKRYKMNLRRVVQMNADRHSLRCDMQLKLHVAEKFAREEEIYYPFNIDFRGRAYPIPPHLNHMGSDICRSLLLFSKGKPLGTEGLRQLKIHLANLMGKDKISLSDRVKYTEENIQFVFDSVDKPFDGSKWWMDADNPWQALATCFELSAALRSEDPHAYVCCLPVHVDGSCNGLQHYAALGRDESGGKAVNLIPSEEDKPQDVYSKVLALVLKRMELDAVGGDASDGPIEAVPGQAQKATAEEALALIKQMNIAKMYKQVSSDAAAAEAEGREDMDRLLASPSEQQAEVGKFAARLLRGHVDRKVVKQTVMTSVYGVTFIGAREQIRARLQEKFQYYEDKIPIDDYEASVFLCATYLARVTLASLGDLFQAADAIKKWLGEVARLVALSNQPMCWTTPLGLPVIQPYRREHAHTIKTILQSIVIADNSEQLPVSISRQKSAFPPNYVHSLDSSHMMLTCLNCVQKGLTFTAVHDSFWTHACDVEVMADALREEFINLYSLPLLENFRDSLELRFPQINFPKLPPRGTLSLELVKKSRYFFS